MKKEKLIMLGAGCAVGVIAALLSILGNPANMGFCIACFVRDIAGGLGLHGAGKFQYVRPEIIGLVLGAFAIAVVRREFSPRGGSSPILRFILGALVMTGAMSFLGCPLRMALRIAGGDLNAIIGLVGFAGGILGGVWFLNNGFSLGRTYKQSRTEGGAFPAITVVLLVLLVALPTLLKFSTEGPGAAHPAIVISLAAGLIVGAIAQRTRLCMAGGIRDAVLFKDATLLMGFVGIIVAALIVNIATSSFKLGFAGQPAAHTEWLWNFLGMAAVGLGSALLGGCPLRQLILAGEGNSDSAVTVLGMLVGAAVCHNFGLVSSGEGTTPGGRVAVIAALVITLAIAGLVTLGVKKKETAAKEKGMVING